MLVRKPNLFCPLIEKSCIEDECAAFQRSRIMTVEERRGYAAADSPMACYGVLDNIRWCSQFQREMPLIFETKN